MPYSQVLATIASIPGLQAHVDSIALKAPLASPSFTGTVSGAAASFTGPVSGTAALFTGVCMLGNGVGNFGTLGGGQLHCLSLVNAWENADTTFEALRVNITDTASHADSLLMRLSLGGVPRFSVFKDGRVLCFGSLTLLGGITAPAIILGGTVASNLPPLQVSQTWNNSGVTFKGLTLDVTDTASAAASKLIDLLVGGASKFSVNKSGCIESGSAVNHGSAALCLGDASQVPKLLGMQNSGGTIRVTSTGSFGFTATADAYSGATDTALHRVSAGVASVTNGTSGTYRDLRVRNILDTNGATVLGTRGAAVADATDAASAITQLNALLARLRATGGHGLIAD